MGVSHWEIQKHNLMINKKPTDMEVERRIRCNIQAFEYEYELGYVCSVHQRSFWRLNIIPSNLDQIHIGRIQG